jgi:selenide,water dikinase
MQTPEQPILRDIVLVGGGHSHVGVIKSFGLQPMPGVRLTVICTDVHTPYSGMLPGYVAGHYDYDEVHIDLNRLAVFAGAHFYRDEVIGLDRANRKVLCRNRPPVPYDVLSINTGSTPQLHDVPGASQNAIAVKPITRFNDRWLALLDRVQKHVGTTTVAVVGAGAGGVELLLAMQFRLRNELRALGRNPDDLTFHLFTNNANILPTHNARVRRTFDAVLAARGVRVHRNAAVTQVSAGRLQTSSGEWVDADEMVWVTRAGGAAWLQDTGLALDADGFIQVTDTLQTVTDSNIFAAGDIAAMVNYPLEKAGVFAVRQGPPLAHNLRLSVQGAALKPYRPQRRWLALISTGDQYAVASRGWLSFAGVWVWRWKDWIDRSFMRKFQDL